MEFNKEVNTNIRFRDKDTNCQIYLSRLVSLFSRQPHLKAFFDEALSLAQEVGSIPTRYSIYREKWQNDEYLSYKILEVRKKARNKVTVQLSDHIWRPRAKLRFQVLNIMYSI